MIRAATAAAQQGVLAQTAVRPVEVHADGSITFRFVNASAKVVARSLDESGTPPLLQHNLSQVLPLLFQPK